MVASPALSQVGKSWPTDGRKIGIVADDTADLDGVQAVRRAIDDAGMVPLVIAPTGGMLGEGSAAFAVQRTFLTARSVEFDAVLVAASPAPAPDAGPAYDAKAAGGRGHIAPANAAVDPRVTLLLAEAFRHAKAIGAWGEGARALTDAGLSGAGVVVGQSGNDTLAQVQDLLAQHRVWDRFPVHRAPTAAP